ncbi:MAG: hypothetical protein M0Z48_00475 [Nitrospiraceae bacterium]|nr:hypothetical protein [Nitrospiraceae bacterium]
MEAPDFTPRQAAYLADLVNNKIQPAYGALEKLTQGEAPSRELAGLSLAALTALAAQINGIVKQAHADAMMEGERV